MHVVHNGLIDDFPKEIEDSWRTSLSDMPKVTIGFLGNMGYAANDLAARKLCEEVLPELRRSMPNLDFRVKVIGKHPSESLRGLAGSSVEVTGEVDEIWTSAQAVDIFVFPMTQGAGMQNKLLEAMRMKRPIVASRLCMAGLFNAQRSQVLAADTPREIAASVYRLVADSTYRQFHIERNIEHLLNFDMEAMVERYIALVRGD